MTVNRILFSHAEVTKDVVEGFLGGDLATCDFGEDVESLAEVFGKEVAGKAAVQAFDDTLDAVVGTEEGVVVSGVGDDDFVAG